MITETETAFLAVVRAFLTEEKAALEELAALTEKQWNHLFVMAAQHSLLSAVYDVVGKTPEFAGLPGELRGQVKTQAMQSILQQVSRTALFLSDEKELTQLGVQPLVMKGIVCRNLYPKPDLRPAPFTFNSDAMASTVLPAPKIPPSERSCIAAAPCSIAISASRQTE